MCMAEITIGDKTIQYTLTRAKRRSIAASILPDGTVAVKAPILVPEFIIRQFLKTRSEWLLSHVEKRLSNPGKNLVPTESGEYMNFFDQMMLVIITENKEAAKTRLYKVNHTFQIIVPQKLTGARRKKEILRVIHEWYKLNMKPALEIRIARYAAIMGVTYERVRVKDVSSHWGSCSVDRNLNFNYRLGMLPVEIADYVIVHELCHLTEMNHSAAFWNLVEKYMPNYKPLRKELKRYHFL